MNVSARTNKPPNTRSWLLSWMWLLCAPGIICLFFAGFLLLGPRGESGGWQTLGVTLLLAPVLLIEAYGGFIFVAAVSLMAWRVIASDQAGRSSKIEAAIAVGISVISAISVWLIHFK